MVNVNNLRRRKAANSNEENSNNLLEVVAEISSNRALTIATERTRREIVAFFKQSAEDGVETEELKVSLVDPISRTRIRIPVRSVKCTHFQCFDLFNFLDFNTKKGNWHCPHCQCSAKREQLRVDGYFQEVLFRVGPEPLEVALLPDGSWKAVEQQDFKPVFDKSADDDVVELVPKKKLKATSDALKENDNLTECQENTTANEVNEDPFPSDLLPLSIGFEDPAGEMRVLIERNSKIPTTKHSFEFHVSPHGRKSITIRIFEGERHLAKNNHFLGEFSVVIPPLDEREASRRHPILRDFHSVVINISAEIDQRRVLRVEVLEKSMGGKYGIAIPIAQLTRTRAEIEQMVAEAVAHRAEDEHEVTRLFAANCMRGDCAEKIKKAEKENKHPITEHEKWLMRQKMNICGQRIGAEATYMKTYAILRAQCSKNLLLYPGEEWEKIEEEDQDKGRTIDDLVPSGLVPLSLGFGRPNGRMEVVIARGTEHPVKVTKLCNFLKIPGQKHLEIMIYEGERPVAKHNKPMYTFQLRVDPPSRLFQVGIEFTIEIDEAGALRILAEEKSSREKTQITLNRYKKRLFLRDEIDKLIVEAERLKAEDEQELKRLSARWNLLKYCHWVKATVEGEKVNEGDDQQKKEKRLLEQCTDVLTWLSSENAEGSATTEEEFKRRELALRECYAQLTTEDAGISKSVDDSLENNNDSDEGNKE